RQRFWTRFRRVFETTEGIQTVGMRVSFQTTLTQRVDLMGRGVHGGTQSRVSLLPADINSGILFSRPGHNGAPDRVISASPGAVRNTDFATVI
ncbi:UDP-3-O-acyl-N-acetylglucosamine deacetylase, partial [Halanaerobium saccharolyticum]|uniref:UDP-3-O-acyl-N-acetylglucosamine deacetylase n=1 Tax=Halanaerobium saccharolyticum TaxID=43595 RepID=UPI003FCD0097